LLTRLGRILCAPKLFRKSLDLDDHFDRPFSFMAMKEKVRNQKEGDHTNSNPSLNKKSQFS
jgi:hypothetical protein